MTRFLYNGHGRLRVPRERNAVAKSLSLPALKIRNLDSSIVEVEESGFAIKRRYREKKNLTS